VHARPVSRANAAAGAAAPNFYMARVLPGGSQTLRVRIPAVGVGGAERHHQWSAQILGNPVRLVK